MIAISGNGVAACCCARLLQGVTPTTLFRAESRLRVPALMLSDGTRMLIEDAFEDKTVFDRMHRIQQRIVAWGSSAEPVAVPHTGIVVAEDVLLERLWPKVHSLNSIDVIPTWKIQCSGKSSPEQIEHRFGSRLASAGKVQLSKHAPQDACWVESVQNGWLFLISSGEQGASVLAIGSPMEQLLEESRLVSKQIEDLPASGFQFPAYPRITTPLSGGDWMACGTGAVGFDPIGGEGVGNAVRGAVLASAVIRAVLRGEDVAALMGHYSARLTAGLLRHLQSCASFYSAGGSSPWWRSQFEELQRGIDWTRAAVNNHPAPSYRLVNFDLESLP